MKDKFQSFEDGMRMAGGSIQHPLSIHSASIGTCRRHRVWQVLMTLVFLFTLSIGQMWATDVAFTAGSSTAIAKKVSTSSPLLYMVRGGGGASYTTDYGIQLKTDLIFVFTLDAAADVKINLKSKDTNNAGRDNKFKLYSLNSKKAGFLKILEYSATNNAKLDASYGVLKASDSDVTDFSSTSISNANYCSIDNNPAVNSIIGSELTIHTDKSSPADGTFSSVAAGTYVLFCSAAPTTNVCIASITFTSSATAPAITAPTTDQSASYTIGGEIAALTVTASGTPTPTYQWYYNSSASTEGATSLGSSAQLASYTPSNAAASDLYYYCVVTNSAGSATSHYFHVTVSAPSTPTHAITYNETSLKGQSVSGYPTTYYEGTGIASFDPLDDVTDWHFDGWDPASISGTEDQDVEVFATWVAAYNVTFSAGAGSGTVPSSFQKWNGATFNLPGQGSMTAPSGKAFDGWKANGTGAKLAANAEYTMGNAAVEFVAQWKAMPTTIFDWTKGEGAQITADETSLNGNNMGTMTIGTSVVARKLGSNNIDNNSAGYKLGNDDVCIEIQGTSSFEDGDTVIIIGKNGGSGDRCFTVAPSSATSAASSDTIKTNTIGSQIDNSVYKVVITSTQAGSKMRVFRLTAKTMYCKSIKVIRPAEREIASTVISLSDLKVNNRSISSDSLAILKTPEAYALTLGDEFAEAPVIKFNEHTVITYVEGLPATKETDKVYTVTATVNGEGKWEAQQTIDGKLYTVTAPKVSSAKVYYYDGATKKLGEEIVAINGNPVDFADFQDKDYATFVSWYNNSDLAEEHKIADIAALVVTKDTTVYGKWNPAYATSINIEQWVLDNGIENAPFRAELTARHYKYATLNNLDSLNDDPSKPYRNYAYLGQKVNKTDSEISFFLKNGSTLKVRFGHLGSDINVIYGTDDPIALTSAEYANESPAGDKVYEYTATADVIVKFQCDGTSTSVFKQIMINEPIATVVLPAIVTLNPNGGKYDDKTENTIVKYTGAPLVIGDATPADADHVFAGWYDGEDQINAAAYVPTANVELLAHYSNTEYTVTYVGGEGATGSMDPVQVAWDAEYTLATNAFAKEGHVWSGWVATYNDGIEEQTLTITEGKITMPKYNVTVTAQWTDVSNKVKIVETDVTYGSFAEAYTAATAGQTIQLLQNIELSGAMFSITKNLTVDLNGKVWSHSNPSAKMIEVVEGATLTINGTAANSEFIGRINLGRATNSNGNLVINGGYYHVGNGQTVLHVNGTCLASNVTITNATFVSLNDNAIQLNGAGAFNISNSSFTGKTGIYLKAGVLTLTACTVNGTGTYTDYTFYQNGSNPTGDAIVVDACGYPGAAPTINIVSGTYNSEHGSALAYYHPQGNPAVGGVTGGTFSSRVPNELCAPGMVPSSADPVTGKYSVEPKDGVSIIKAEATATVQDITGEKLTGIYKGAAHIQTSTGYKLNQGNYFMVQLKEGENFKAGDVVEINVVAQNDGNGFAIYKDASFTSANLIIDTHDGTGAAAKVSTGINVVKLPNTYLGSNKLYVGRPSDGDKYLNAGIDQVEVFRAMYPILTAITFDGVVALEGAGNTFTITLPEATTDLNDMEVVPTIIRNAAHATTPEAVISNEGAWVEGANTYRVMDKDGDYTDYTITITLQAEAPVPSITVQPAANTAYCAGSEPTLSVEASVSEGALHYAWFKEAGETDEAVGEDAASYTIASAGTYYVIVTNHVEGKLDKSVTSDNAVVTMNAAAAITTQPSDLKKQIEGDMITLSVVATNATGYQWYSCDDKEKTNPSLIAGAESADYEFAAAAGFYYCAVNGLCGVVESNVAQVTVKRTAGCQYIAATSGYETTESGLYICGTANSDGKQATSGNVFATASENAKAIDDGAVGSFSSQYILLKFPVDIEEFTMFGYNNSARSINNVRVNNEIGPNIKFTSDMEVEATKTATKEGSDISMTAVLAEPISKDNYVYVKFSSSLEVYRICYTAALAKPVVPTLLDQDLCAGDAIAELDGTSTKEGEGTLSYQWFNGDTDEPIDGATNAKYTPTEDGKYYVQVTNAAAGRISNIAKSNTITITHFAGTAITSAPANVRKTVGEAAALTVEATGKNLSYVWFTCDDAIGTNPEAIVPAETNATLNVIVPDGIQYYMVVVSSECGAAVSAVAKVEKFVPVAQVVVDNSVVWDLTTCADAEIKLDGTTSPKKGEECLMANIEGVHMDENFHSESLVFAGEYIYRTSGASGHPTCATYMKFETSVAGLVRVHFAGNGANRCLRITSSDKVQYSSVSTGTGNDLTEEFEVAAGEIELMGMNSGHTSDKQYMRFYQIEFFALAHQRTSGYNVGDLGTVCLEDATFIEGASLYELQGLDEHGYLAFDEISTGELEAGKPYLFEVINPNKISFYKPIGAAHSDTEIETNGMIGTFAGTTLNQGAENYYYFSGRHIWRVNDFTVSIAIPAHRCYVDMDALQPVAAPAPAPGRRRVTMGVQGGQVVTGMENLNAGDQPVKVMINGQLFILRGEKMYDATGRLVK